MKYTFATIPSQMSLRAHAAWWWMEGLSINISSANLAFKHFFHWCIILSSHIPVHCVTQRPYSRTNTHIRRQTDVPCPHGPTKSKTPFKRLLWLIEPGCLSLSPHTHTHTHTHTQRLPLWSKGQGQMPHPSLGDWHPVPRVSYRVNQTSQGCRPSNWCTDNLSLSACSRSSSLARFVHPIMNSRVNVVRGAVFTRWD